MQSHPRTNRRLDDRASGDGVSTEQPASRLRGFAPAASRKLHIGVDSIMWRAFFCAIGIVLLILGVECLLIDSAILAAGVVDDPMPVRNAGLFGATNVQASQNRIFRPAEWIPWSLLASGAVTLLYAVSLRRNNG